MPKTNWIAALSIGLAAQLGLALLLQSAELERGKLASDEPLVAFDVEQVDELEIRTADGQVRLVESEGGWTLPDYHAFAASGSRVEGLIERIHDLEPGWPVGRSDDAARRFEVSEQTFERKLTLRSDGEDLATVYFGTSPGFRKVHARAEGESEIYAVEFGAFEASDQPSAWIDSTTLQRPASTLSRIEIGDLALVRRSATDEVAREERAAATAATGDAAASADGSQTDAPTSDLAGEVAVEPAEATADTEPPESVAPEPASVATEPAPVATEEWQLDGLAEGERSDSEAIRKLVDKIAQLRIRDVLGVEGKAEYGQAAPLAQIKVYPAEGDVMTYTVSEPSESANGSAGGYVLKVSGRPHFFSISKEALRPVIEAERKALLVQPEGSEASEALAPDASSNASDADPAGDTGQSGSSGASDGDTEG